MRKVEKIVGTAFTRRKTTHDVAETPDEIAGALRQWADSEFFDDPWAGHRREVEAACAALALEIAAKPEGYQFKEREDTGWYLQRLITQGRLVQHHIEKGAAAWAAHEAALFGETFSELQLKLSREKLFILGKDTREERSRGGAATRQGSDEGRVHRVRHYLAEGDKLSEAYGNAARDLGCGVSTVRGAWARLKKGANATD